jgi:anti-sigma factor RsiW
MNCSEWEERIGLYAGDDLAAEAAEVERHLAECAKCREFAVGLRESLASLKEAHTEIPAEASFAAVRARVLGELRRGRVPMWRRAWVYGLAAVALAVIVGLRIRETPRVSPPVAVAQPAEMPAMEHGAVQPHQPPAHARSPRRRVRLGQPAVAEPLMIKLETDNPDVVIYWIAEKRGD